jgi:hypothetical protein
VLVCEQLGALPVDIQRLALPSRTVQSQHELATQFFPEEVFPNQAHEFGDQQRVFTDGEPRVDQVK